MKTIRIGTRASELALWQSNWVKTQLSKLKPDYHVELLKIKTTGDKITDVPLARVGGKGLFVKEIEEALLDGRVDLAVHSMKDMPAILPDGLCVGAVPARENTQDVLISKGGLTFSQLPNASRIGSSSLRRGSQVLHARPDFSIHPLRGNLDTRIRKLDDEGLDAIILAAAGLRRLGLADRITEYLSEELMLPAIAQGALCIEVREGDELISDLVSNLDHEETRVAVECERSFLARLEGGCQVPIAGKAHLAGDQISFTGLVAEVDGSVIIRQTITGPAGRCRELGTQLAERLLDMGGGEILQKVYASSVSSPDQDLRK